MVAHIVKNEEKEQNKKNYIHYHKLDHTVT